MHIGYPFLAHYEDRTEIHYAPGLFMSARQEGALRTGAVINVDFKTRTTETSPRAA